MTRFLSIPVLGTMSSACQKPILEKRFLCVCGSGCVVVVGMARGGGDMLSRRLAKLALLWPHLSLLPCLLMSPVSAPAWSGLEARGMGHTIV